MKNYRYVKQYHNTKVLKKDIKKALKTAWLESPSKNNFMPYKVHVLGPEFREEKEKLYWLCLSNETKANGNHITDLKELKNYQEKQYGDSKPAFYNVTSAPYVLIFTQRVEDTPNEFQKSLISEGYVYEQMAEDGPKKENAKQVASLEIGMFSANFTRECLDKDIDISHTLCFPKDFNDWPQEHFAFLDSRPMLIMTVGYGKIYREYKYQVKDPKPDFHRIINIVKKFD